MVGFAARWARSRSSSNAANTVAAVSNVGAFSSILERSDARGASCEVRQWRHRVGAVGLSRPYGVVSEALRFAHEVRVASDVYAAVAQVEAEAHSGFRVAHCGDERRVPRNHVCGSPTGGASDDGCIVGLEDRFAGGALQLERHLDDFQVGTLGRRALGGDLEPELERVGDDTAHRTNRDGDPGEPPAFGYRRNGCFDDTSCNSYFMHGRDGSPEREARRSVRGLPTFWYLASGLPWLPSFLSVTPDLYVVGIG